MFWGLYMVDSRVVLDTKEANTRMQNTVVAGIGGATLNTQALLCRVPAMMTECTLLRHTRNDSFFVSITCRRFLLVR